MRGREVLIVRGAGGREYLKDELERRGARVRYATVYRRLKPAADIGGEQVLKPRVLREGYVRPVVENETVIMGVGRCMTARIAVLVIKARMQPCPAQVMRRPERRQLGKLGA